MTQIDKRPMHLWIVGIVATVWNSMGPLDYTMTQMRNEGWLSAFTPEQRSWMDSFPAWAEAFWAIGVWSALVASLLLLLRSRHALAAYVVSLAGLAGTTVFQFFVAQPSATAMMGEGAAWFTAVIWISIIALIWYSRRQVQAGALR